jgi:nucleoside 2-deoxyribosyltransferase
MHNANGHKVYIATGYSNKAEHNAVRDECLRYGLELTHDWTLKTHKLPLTPHAWRTIAKAEKQGVLRAELIIVLLPGGMGTHTELGMALACDIPVLIHTTDDDVYYTRNETVPFYQLANVIFSCDAKSIAWHAARTLNRKQEYLP